MPVGDGKGEGPRPVSVEPLEARTLRVGGLILRGLCVATRVVLLFWASLGPSMALLGLARTHQQTVGTGRVKVNATLREAGAGSVDGRCPEPVPLP